MEPINILEPILENVQKLRGIETIFQRIPFLRDIYQSALIRLSDFFRLNYGFKVLSESWDFLIVLDACRYDYFKRLNWNEHVEKRISAGSHTREWTKENFKTEASDIVYISGNPQISSFMLKKNIGFVPFHEVEEVWDYGWDENLGTVPPHQVTNAALKKIKDYPNKRIIVHYMQPHHPFIANHSSTIKGDMLPHPPEMTQKYKEKIDPEETIWDLVKNGKIDIDFVKREYLENLKLVIKEVKKLVNSIEGKIAITADHGNCFGEYFIYSHPKNLHIRPLLEVPWLILNK